MNNICKLVDLPSGHWAVSWDNLEPIYRAIGYSKKGLITVAADMGCRRIGLGLQVNRRNNEIYTMWIDTWCLSTASLVDLEVHTVNTSAHDMIGMVFEEEKYARQMYEYIGRHLTFHTLKAVDVQ
jgi:hypothetical protein